MSQHVRDAFIRQGEACRQLGSAFMGRLMPLIGDRLSPDTAVGARCLGWTGDVGPSGHSVPLRLAGGLHGLVLDGGAPDLAAAYPPNTVSEDALWAAVAGALTRQEERLLAWLDRAPQTNEVRRAAAVMAGIWWALGRIGDRPVVLSELGASAGLNLNLDRFSVAVGAVAHRLSDAVVALTPEWRGGPPPDPRPIIVTDRAGADLTPLDLGSSQDRIRLLAYLWPDQPERLARTRAAMEIASVTPAASDAAGWLATRLQARWPGALHVVYTTIAAQYFPPETTQAIATSLGTAGSAATAHAPLMHFAMEADAAGPGAGLTATLWAGGAPQQVKLGRAHSHADWIHWDPAPADAPFFPCATSAPQEDAPRRDV